MNAAARLDQRLLLIARTRRHRTGLERAAQIYSRLGEHGTCWLALGAAGVAVDPDRQRRAHATTSFAGALAAWPRAEAGGLRCP